MRATPVVSLSLLALVLAQSVTAEAQVRKFPYRAAVASADAYVRSGPGKRFYATGKLKNGDEVVVHRHDPGGWYMIAPPPGSFSWIREEYVAPQGGNTGVVRENNVVVRVGSEYGDVRDVEQRRLSKGDRVQILGRKTVQDEYGTVSLLRIQPPAGEYRWISGRGIVPVDRDNQIAGSRNPYSTPAGVEPPPTPTAPAIPEPEDVADSDPLGGFEERPLVRVRSGDAIADRRSDPAAVAREQRELREIDLDFKTMIEQDPTTWDLSDIRDRYRNLQRESKQPSVAGAVPARLAAVARYEKVEREYREFVTLTRGTTAKDAELVALQRSKRPTTPSTPPPSNPSAPSQPPAFVGAGIVQRAATAVPNGPTHVLLHPGGRILAYLRGNGTVDLDAWLGRSVGVVGDRAFDAALQADVITARQLADVKLAP